MIPLLLDQGLPRSTPSHLQRLGITATHVADIGLSRADDARIIDEEYQGISPTAPDSGPRAWSRCWSAPN
ncbi:DUF5615 family PIN-like protein [uncultured Thiodictyon sp.]|uniref:DUF5615 family PIN-like protein n=1 Tax=uncultured Thiodictyon sp. TaxID=1846217 RepID=UPI00345AA409